MHHAPTSSPRPIPLPLIGWVWIALGAFAAVSALMALATFSLLSPGEMLREFEGAPGAPEGMREAMALFSLPFEYVGFVAAVQIAFAVAAVVSGLALLRRRRWGRVMAEALSWITLASLIAYGVFWSVLVYRFTQVADLSPNPSPEAVGVPFAAFGVVMVIFGIVIMAVMAVPFVLMIKHLRSPAVRAALEGDRDA